jgi:hypothetical protein
MNFFASAGQSSIAMLAIQLLADLAAERRKPEEVIVLFSCSRNVLLTLFSESALSSLLLIAWED